MAEEMSSSAWVLMDDCADCGGPPPMFNLPPPPVPPDLPCDMMDMTCPNILNVSDAEFKRIGSFPSVTVIVCCTLLSFVILLVIAALVWKYVRIKKKRKGVTASSKDFDHHHGPTMMNGNGVLYEDLTNARPRPPIAPPSIEMMDVSHQTLGPNGMMGNPKMDFSYFLNPPPIYEELPDLSDRHGPSDDEFAEDELSVIDVPVNHEGMDPATLANMRYQQSQQYASGGTGRNSSKRAQSLTRKRPSRSSSGSGANASSNNGSNQFKSQRSLDRRSRNNLVNSGLTLGKYNGTSTNPRGGYSKHNLGGMDDNNMLILSNPNNGMTMKIPPHLVAVLAESCNGGGARPYEVIPTSLSGGHANPSSLGVGNGGVLVNGGGGGIYPSSRSSGSSYGEGGSSSSSARINPSGNSIESSSFDSGIGPHSITSFINSPAYDQAILGNGYHMNPYEYATGQQMNASQYHNSSQHPSFRRLRMTVADRDHPLNPLYSNHLLT